MKDFSFAQSLDAFIKIKKDREDNQKKNEMKNQEEDKTLYKNLIYINIAEKIKNDLTKFFQEREIFENFSINDNYEENIKKYKDYPTKINCTILMQEYFQKYYLMYFLKINIEENTINLTAFLTFKDFSRVSVEAPMLRLLIARYFTRINWTFRFGALTIDSWNGEIFLKMNTIIDETMFNYSSNENKMEEESLNKGEEKEKKKEASDLIKNLKISFSTAKMSMDFHVLKILYLINLISEGDYRSLDQEGLENNTAHFRKLYADHPEKIRLFKSICKKIDKKDYFIPLKSIEENKIKNKSDMQIKKDSFLFLTKDLSSEITNASESMMKNLFEWAEKEIQFLKLMKDVQLVCKEERLLDEMMESADEYYHSLKESYYEYRKIESEILNDTKYISYFKSCSDTFKKKTKEKSNIITTERSIFNFDKNEKGDIEKLKRYEGCFFLFLKRYTELNSLFLKFKYHIEEEDCKKLLGFKASNSKDQDDKKKDKWFKLNEYFKQFDIILTISEQFLISEFYFITEFMHRTLLSSNNENIKKNERLEKWREILISLVDIRKLSEEFWNINEQYETIKKFEEYFKLPKLAAIKNFEPTIYSEIKEIKKIHESKLFSVGGFAEIHKITADLVMKNKNEVNNKVLIQKKGKISKNNNVPDDKTIYDNIQRINNEKKILNGLKDAECPYIAKFYHCSNKDYADSLFVEFYPFKSLDQFKTYYGPTMSLNTKLYILYQIAQALKFLKDKNIYHLDLKPGNILLSKNYIVKVIDFGESYNKSDISQKDAHKPGRTLPFAPPEILSEKINYNDQIDVFSFGVLMCDLIFDDYIVDFRRSHLNLLQTKYIKGNYKVRLLEDIIKGKGPKHVMKLLRFVILSCVEFNVDNRASIEWIIITLRESLSYLEKMY